MGICRAYKSVDLVREEPIRVTVESTVFGPDKVQYAVGPLDAGRLGMGLGAEVTQEILRYGFDELGLHRIDLRVLAHNTRGFAATSGAASSKRDASVRRAYVSGAWHDEVIMGMLEHEAGRP